MLPLILALGTLSHPDSISSTRIEVTGLHGMLQLRSEVRTFLESLPVDTDADGRLSAAEQRKGAWMLADYVLERYRVAALVEGGAERPLEPAFLGLEALESADRPALQLAFEFELPPGCTGLAIRSQLFVENNPLHRDQCEIVWEAGPPATRILWVEDPSWTFLARGTEHRGVVLVYAELGVRHILEGYDHLAFVLALVVASRGLRALVGVISAFTLAHSITLGCAAAGWIALPTRPIEVLIALSIVFVALRNLVERRSRRLWPEAFGFGLVHGLGFAGVLAETLAAESQKLRGLFGFNLGVEIGQLAVVLVAVGVLALLRRAQPPAERERLAPGWLRVATSACVAVLGCYWVLARAW